MASLTQSARAPWCPSWPFVLLLISTLQLRAVEADTSLTISSTPNPVSSASSQVHTVKVGLADHKFEPDVTLAGVGDVSSCTRPCLHNVSSSFAIVEGGQTDTEKGTDYRVSFLSGQPQRRPR
jgi:hypothetical protein